MSVKKDDKGKIKRLARLIEFLENPPERKHLEKHEDQQKVIDLLGETLEMRQNREYGDDPVVQIYMTHQLLVGFWEKFKAEIFIAQNRLEKEQAESPHSLPNVDLEFEVPFTVKVQARFQEVLNFFDTCLDSLKAFHNLMHGLPLSIFKQCQGCGRSIVLTSRHPRDYCNQNCANKHIQKMKRESDPEAYRKYHKDRYRKQILGEWRPRAKKKSSSAPDKK